VLLCVNRAKSQFTEIVVGVRGFRKREGGEKAIRQHLKAEEGIFDISEQVLYFGQEGA
jgi:hypothetical protein